MKVKKPNNTAGQQSQSRSNAVDHNYLLGGKDVSLVVTVSVITEERKVIIQKLLHVHLVRQDQCSTSFHGRAWIIQIRLTHLRRSPLRLYWLGTESCVFSNFCHATVTKCITAMKDFFFFKKFLETWQWTLLNHSNCCKSKTQVRLLTSFLWNQL